MEDYTNQNTVQTPPQAIPEEPIQPIQPTTPTVESPIQPITPQPVEQPVMQEVLKPKSKLLPILITFLLIGLLSFLGYWVYNKYFVSQEQTTVEVSPTPVATIDPTADWETYTNNEYKFQFKYPSFLNISVKDFATESGSNFYIYLYENENYISYTILFGSISENFSGERGGMFTDTQGYVEKNGNYYCKSVSSEVLIDKNRVRKIINTNNIEMLLISSGLSEPNVADETNCTEPGFRNIGVLMNLNENSKYNGLGILFKKDNASILLNEEIFNQILSTFKFLDQTGGISANWKTYISPCGYSVKFPDEWKAQKYFVVNSDDSCSYLTAPDYTQGLDTRTGFYITFRRFIKGTVNMGIPVNTAADYIKALESMQDPKVLVENKTEKTYGSIAGTQFDYSAMESITNFIFLKDNYFWTIEWPTTVQYKGNYISSIDQILSTFKFTE